MVVGLHGGNYMGASMVGTTPYVGCSLHSKHAKSQKLARPALHCRNILNQHGQPEVLRP